LPHSNTNILPRLLQLYLARLQLRAQQRNVLYSVTPQQRS
jgi:hypothetical protein